MRTPNIGKALLASAVGVAVLAGFATPAGAATTTATFTLTGGTGLAITAPESSTLGGGTTESATTPAAQMGTITVSDTRGALAGAWTASVESSDFTTSGEGAPVIGKANVSYWSGAETSSSGTAIRVPGQLMDANKVALDVARTAFSASGVIGNNTAAWNPTVTVTIPSGAVAGTYTGTITHSVA